ncbi:unnamed protein product [Effrenium voratum]|nr:unnamed protein product [Effrenium voratum]
MGASVSEEKEVISSEAKETEVKEALQNAAKLLASLVEKQKAWEDPSFPPGQGALCHDWQALPKAKSGRFATLVWCRCEEAMGAKQVPIFPSTGPVPTDVRQGMLGDCYFLAALSSIAEVQF